MRGKRYIHRKTLRERALGVWNRYREVKHGLVGLAIVIAFTIIALSAPLIFPLYPGQLVRVGPNYAAPQWMSWTDPLDPPTGNYIPDPSFDSDLYWSFSTTDPEVGTYEYDTADYVTGSRSVHFILTDNNNTVAYNATLKGSISFDWPYHMPALTYIHFSMKAKFSGNLTDNSVTPYVALEVPPGSLISPSSARYEIPPSFPTEWKVYKRNVHYLAMYYVFVKDSTIHFEFGLEFQEEDPSLVGTAEFWFDQVELVAFSHFWGPLGTTSAGQDVLAQLFWGAQVSLFVGLVATLIGVTVGMFIGLIAGYFGGRIDEVLMRVVDFFLIMPSLPIMMVLAALLRPSLEVTVFVISLFAWPGPSRVIRSQCLVEREKAYVEAARAAGAGDVYLIFRHVLPNVLTLVFVQLATGVSGAILSEAGLSFLGLTPQNLVSWGRMLQEAYAQGAMAVGAWWFVIPPGFCIALMSMGFVFIGYAVDKALNPRLRKL